MKLIYFLTVFSMIFTSVNANFRQDEDWETKTYDLGEFTEIYLEGGYKVYLIQGDKNSLTVKASDGDVFDYLKVRNESESLRLKIDRKHFDFERITLYITFKNIEKINIEGGVKLETKGYLDLNDFFLHVKGGAKIELDLKAEDVRVISEGGVLFEFDGVAENLDVKVSGAGHIDASELKTKNVTIKIEGVGTGSVYATETLNAKIEGVGKVKYRGEPKVTKSIEGLGSVTRD
ncbi:MAG: DUF2807 domain-containing protein [Prolixibacteraceae bacterium]|jgi:hypothetical protein|nr:DUF2807 domain-containing protein [Prolixibacteraceae bacterium]MBT6004216.1 DUF2807 domain-containing protein [Prolixibacteraceae bacterium]MBT6765508.1 DUF2807 domain-containing protein [Prolixibacteraceae bacterium]MBT6997053.1 DUF2807 domain-containing protein [Prolixibacteraceae bacterium]MBT7396892.1 DUF2807 domain-containing protein [Prolixibacteraceae bacterium]